MTRLVLSVVSLLLSSCQAGPASKLVPGALHHHHHDHHEDLPVMTPEQKESFIKELEDAQMLKELEVLIQNLDDEQLENLEEILTDDIDHATEFEKIVKELRTMGLDEEDIEDLRQLATLMNQFLIQVPGLELKLEMKGGSDLLDNIQVQTRDYMIMIL